MLKGKLTVLAGLSLGQRLMIALTPFFPLKFILKTVHKLQQTVKQ